MEESQENKTHWTTNDLAAAVGVDPARIRQLLIDGRELHGYKIGRDWAVPDYEAKRWLRLRGVEVN